MKLLKWNGLEIDPSKHIESTTVKPNILPESKIAFSEAKGDTGARFILPRIEAIHAGTTRNNTRYVAERLKGDPAKKSGVYSWLHPYPKPVIYNHDTNTDATGRVYNAAYAPMTQAGKEGIIVIPKITDAAAVQGVLDGRLMTVSIGATTDSAVCSYCGTDIIAEGFCGHMKGEVIDGTTVEWIIGDVWFDELSWVNVPADQNAMVVDPGIVQTAEAFAKAGESFIHLGRKSTEWVLTRESAEDNGLVIPTEMEGDTNVTVEQLQAQIDQLTADIQQVTTEKTDIEARLSTAEATIAEKDSEVQAKETQISEMQAQLDAKDVELVEATSAKETAEATVAELQTTVSGLETEREGLLNKNTELSSEMHKATAERVVDLKVVLGKVSNREETLEQHITRSVDSLKDSLADLLVEASTFKPARATVEAVENPAVGAIKDGKEANVVEGVKKPLTKEDALAGLFRGPGATKRK